MLVSPQFVINLAVLFIQVCKAGAAQKGVPLYRHIAELAGTGKLVLPVP